MENIRQELPIVEGSAGELINKTTLEKPRVEVDKEAIRFIYPEGQTNLFWQDLFLNLSNHNWHAELNLMIKKMYDECIKQDIEVKVEEQL